jgi:hypothetical protein
MGSGVIVTGCHTHWSPTFGTFRCIFCYLSSHFGGILWCLIRFGMRATMMTPCVDGIWRIMESRMWIVIYTGHTLLLGRFRTCVLLDMQTEGGRGFPTPRVYSTLISMRLSFIILPYLLLPHPVCNAHIGMQAFWWQMAVKWTLRGVKTIFCIRWLMPEQSHAFDDIWTPVFDRVLVIVIPSYILDFVLHGPQEPDHLTCEWRTSGHNYCSWSLGNPELGVLSSARCHSTSSYTSLSCRTGYISTSHASQMGNRNYLLHIAQDNPECRFPKAQQCIDSLERRSWGMFLSLAEVVVVMQPPCLR